MNKTAIKNFAVWARRELIARVTQKAMQYGITEKDPVPGSAESVNGNVLTEAEKKQRTLLLARIHRSGYSQTMEEIAYTWFNRFCALRFMEVNGYLPTLVRVFTDEEGAFHPQILADAIHLELDGLDQDKVFALKDANRTEELYKYLLITQCNALSSILPGMFQKIEDETELLFPDNLLREESVIAHMVREIPEEDWQDAVQIIGWLYQYYNSEPKDQVFANLKKNIKISKENIPAATQLFTPDWIVRYMVENSLGRIFVVNSEQWLVASKKGEPERIAYEKAISDKLEWKYFLVSSGQKEVISGQWSVNSKVVSGQWSVNSKVISGQWSVNSASESEPSSPADAPASALSTTHYPLSTAATPPLSTASPAAQPPLSTTHYPLSTAATPPLSTASPAASATLSTPHYPLSTAATPLLTTLKVIDPCMGSGHILAYMFDVLMQIYRESGYDDRDAVAGIVTNNLFGLDIDDRAAQLAYFAVMMKARQYDRGFFRRHLQPKVYAICESNNVSSNYVDYFCKDNDKLAEETHRMIAELRDAKEYGSILNVTPADFSAMYARLEEMDKETDFEAVGAAMQLRPLIRCAEAMAQKYDAVVTNPPYMGGGGMNGKLVDYVKAHYPDSKADLFAVFIDHGFDFLKPAGYSAMVTMQSWMFLSSFEKLRTKLLDCHTIECLVHMANMVMGIAFGTSATVWQNRYMANYPGNFCFVEYEDLQNGEPVEFPPANERNLTAAKRSNSEAEKSQMFQEEIR